MTSLQEQLLKDLERKLALDMANACEHFVDMCELAEIPGKEMWGSLVTLLISRSMELALLMGVSPEALVQAIDLVKKKVAREL